MSTKIIYIDPGHGGKDPGTVNGTRTEADDVLWLSRLIRDKFAAYDADARLTRDGNYDVTIKERCAMANKARATFFCSIHRNAASASATGNEIWIYSGSKQEAVDRAARILNAICKANGLKNRGVKKGAPKYTDFGVNRDTKMPAMLCEVGFLTNAKDNAAYDKTLDAMAEAICSTICAEFGIKPKASGYSGQFPTVYPFFSLKRGSKGVQVQRLQAFLNWYDPRNALAVDGDFGPKTDAAVKAFQKAEGLVVDGKFGVNSLAAAKAVKR